MRNVTAGSACCSDPGASMSSGSAAATLEPPPAQAAADPDPAPSGLTAEQMQALQAARRDGRKITRAAFVAAFSGWTLATFAFLSLLGGLFSLSSLLLGIGMSVSAIVELRGSKALRRLDPAAPRRLGLNQIALGVMLCLYGGWGILAVVTGPGPYDEQIASGGDVAEMLEPIAALHMTLQVAVYAALALGGFIATACTSLYYFTRSAHLNAYRLRTPDWIVETLRTIG